MYINLQEINDLVRNGEITPYKIQKATGIPHQALDVYRNGESRTENMSVGRAMALQKFINEEKRERGEPVFPERLFV